MVIVFDAHVAVTPAGKSVATPIPVAPVVVCVIPAKAVPLHTGVIEPALTVFVGVIIISPDTALGTDGVQVPLTTQ